MANPADVAKQADPSVDATIAPIRTVGTGSDVYDIAERFAAHREMLAAPTVTPTAAPGTAASQVVDSVAAAPVVTAATPKQVQAPAPASGQASTRTAAVAAASAGAASIVDSYVPSALPVGSPFRSANSRADLERIYSSWGPQSADPRTERERVQAEFQRRLAEIRNYRGR